MTSTATTPHPAPPGEGPGQAARQGSGLWSSPWAALAVAVLGWFVGLLPWLVRRAHQGTFGTPWSPRNDLREALLPYHHQLLPLLLTVTVVAGLLAGSAPWCSTARRSRRLLLAVATTVGAALAAGWSVAQTLAPDPDLGGSGTTSDRVRLAFIALTAAGALVGLALGLTVSLGGPAWRAVATAPAAVFVADWTGSLVPTATSGPLPTWLPTVLAATAGAVAGLALASVGAPALRRVAAWVGSLGLLVATAAALTATRYVLEALRGTPVRADALSELLDSALQVFGGALGTTLTAWGPWPAPPLVALVVAATVGVVGTLRATRRATLADTGGATS